jgi:hypothetical protein
VSRVFKEGGFVYWWDSHDMMWFSVNANECAEYRHFLKIGGDRASKKALNIRFKL